MNAARRGGDIARPVVVTDLPLIGPVAAPGLHVMSLNIRRRTTGMHWRTADRWEVRAPRLEAMLRMEQPAVLGLQEVMPGQASAALSALGRSYRTVGQGRSADSRGESCPIIYDSERLELESWEQRALSDRPTVPGSATWGNLIPRIMVSATFQDRATTARFIAVNTHFDHVSRRSRLRSAQALRDHVTAQSLPAVVTGDLNTGEDTAPLRELFSGGALADSWRAAAVRLTAEWGTFPNYRPPRADRKRIDWIAVSPGLTVDLAAINPRRYAGGWASDHLPVQAVIVLPAERRSS